MVEVLRHLKSSKTTRESKISVSWFKPNNVTLVPNCPGLSLCLPLHFYMQRLYEMTLKSYNIVLQIGIIGWGYNGSWTFTQIYKLSVKQKRTSDFWCSFKQLWISPRNLCSSSRWSEFFSMPSTQPTYLSAECMDYWIS